MNFLESFTARCEARGESPSHALEAAGLSKSFLSKVKKYPTRVPSGESLDKIAKYFGCTVDDLLYSAPANNRSVTAIKIQSFVDKMEPEQQEYLYRMIRFIWSEKK